MSIIIISVVVVVTHFQHVVQFAQWNVHFIPGHAFHCMLGYQTSPQLTSSKLIQKSELQAHPWLGRNDDPIIIVQMSGRLPHKTIFDVKNRKTLHSLSFIVQINDWAFCYSLVVLYKMFFVCRSSSQRNTTSRDMECESESCW